MLYIEVPSGEFWDERKQEFINFPGQKLQLEHSLVSISKWESKWHKSFLATKDKTMEETIDYIRCMTLTQNLKPDVFRCLSTKNYAEIYAYIEDPMTATTFFMDKGPQRPSREVVTSEVIYYWMIANNIPMECQKWHINRLLTLIKVCSIKGQPQKKMSKSQVASRYSALNAARRRRLNTRG